MKVNKVRIYLRVRRPDGSRPYLDPVFSANGKLKPGYALLDDAATHFPDSVYHLRFFKAGKRVWEAVGCDAQLALIAKIKREKTLEAIAAGVTVADDGPAPAKRTVLAEAMSEYLEEVAAHKSKKTDAAYSIALKLFSASCVKRHLEEINRKDLLAFMQHLRSLGNGPRTVANRVANVKRFFNSVGAEWPLKKEDKPKYTEKLVDAYSTAEIQQLLAAADTEEAELLQFFLSPGDVNKRFSTPRGRTSTSMQRPSPCEKSWT